MLNWLFHTVGGVASLIAVGWLGVMTPLTWAFARYWRQIGIWHPEYPTGEYGGGGEVDENDRDPEIQAAIFWPFFWAGVAWRWIVWPVFTRLVVRPTSAFYSRLGDLSDRLAVQRQAKATLANPDDVESKARVDGTDKTA